MAEPEANLSSLSGSQCVVCGSLGAVLLAPFRGLEDKNYFHNSTKTLLFASFAVLTFTLVGKIADVLAQITAVVPNNTSSRNTLHSHMLTGKQGQFHLSMSLVKQ